MKCGQICVLSPCADEWIPEIFGQSMGAVLGFEALRCLEVEYSKDIMSTDGQALFLQMIGGDEERFFHHYWRRRTLLIESALPRLRAFYDCAQFLQDYHHLAFHKATLLISVDNQGNRTISHADSEESVKSALAGGMSLVLQALVLPADLKGIPQQWRWFLDLHRDLCEYLLPTFSTEKQPGAPVAAVDIFFTSSETCSGGHYDTGDVFYFVLEGEKDWDVEPASDIENGIRLNALHSKADLSPGRSCQTIKVCPGDCLYVPPYTYHRVSSKGRSLAVSVGLPTFTELSSLKTLLYRIHKEPALNFPLPTFPQTQDVLFRSAEDERKQARRRTIDTICNLLQL